MANKFNFDKVISDFRKVKARMMKDISQETLKHFDKSFPNEGFTDSALSKWKLRKFDYPWNILEKTGKMRRGTKISYISLAKCVIVNDVPYAKYHNFGTTRLPVRQFVNRSLNLDNKCVDIIEKNMINIFKI